MLVDHRMISIRMPTEREHEHNNPELKSDSRPTNRLAFLDHASSLYQYPLAWLTPTGCLLCTSGRYIVTALALYGLYSLFF